MKTLKMAGIILAITVLTSSICYAQKGTITVTVKGIKEAKGKIMIAFGDQSRPQEMVYGIFPVTSTNNFTCVLQGVPVGTGGLYAYQDLNENRQLDKDENQVPIEPCYSKEKITIKDGDNKLEIKLINVKELMSAQ